MPTRVLTPYVGSDGIQKLKVIDGMCSSFPRPFPCLANGMPFVVEFAAPEQAPRGLTPPVLSGSVHVVRSLAQLRSKDKDIEKYIYLQQLKDADHNVFYHICLNHMSVSNWVKSSPCNALTNSI